MVCVFGYFYYCIYCEKKKQTHTMCKTNKSLTLFRIENRFKFIVICLRKNVYCQIKCLETTVFFLFKELVIYTSILIKPVRLKRYFSFLLWLRIFFLLSVKVQWSVILLLLKKTLWFRRIDVDENNYSMVISGTGNSFDDVSLD